jgi:hypothetical protein
MLNRRIKELTSALVEIGVKKKPVGLTVVELGKKLGVVDAINLKSYQDIVNLRRQQFQGDTVQSVTRGLPAKELKTVKGFKKGDTKSGGFLNRVSGYSKDDLVWLREAILGRFIGPSEEEIDFHIKSIYTQVLFSILSEATKNYMSFDSILELNYKKTKNREFINVLRQNLELLLGLDRLSRLKIKKRRIEKKLNETQDVDPFDVFERLFEDKKS